MPSAGIENSKASRLKIALYIVIIILAVNIALHLLFASFTYKGDVSVVSHRGAAAIAPENTLGGVSAGVDAGAPYIEVDVRATKDGVLVLMHDSTVNRTTDGSGIVGDLSWEYLSGLDAGARFGEEFKAERVPRLDSILGYMKGRPSKLVIEVKSPGRYPVIGSLLRETLRRYVIQRDVVTVSFDAQWIIEFGGLMPGVTLGILYVYPFSVPPADEVSYVGIFWPSLVLDPTLVWRMKNKGFKVWAWNIDNHLLAKFLIWKGVDGLTLDRPGLISDNECM